MEVKIVLGMAFGDEGKGVTVQSIARQALNSGKSVAVVRFSGGPQAAHTVINDGKKHICSTYGAGVLLGVTTYLLPTVYFDPYCAYQEFLALRELGLKHINLVIPRNVRTITPWDVLHDRQDFIVGAHGSCGKGIHATFVRCNKNVPAVSARHWYKTHFGFESEEAIEIEKKYEEAARELGKLSATICSEHELMADLHNYDVLIFEGSQGLLLDMDKGFFPHVTPSHTGLDNIPLEFLRDAEVYLVTRSYTTRHGNGWTPRGEGPVNFINEQDCIETNVMNEFQGKFKTGALDIPMLGKAWDRHCLDVWQRKYRVKYNLVITHADAFREYGGPDKAVQIIYNEDPRLGENSNPNIKYISRPTDALRRMPFCNSISKLFITNDPAGDLIEIDPTKTL